jgi:hypothetical protein
MELARRGWIAGLVSAVASALHLRLERSAHELIGVIDDEAKLGRILRVDAARVLLGDDDGAVDSARAHVFPSFVLVGVVNGGEGLDVGRDGIEALADLQRLRAPIVVHNSHARAHDLAAKGVAHNH